AGGDVARHRVGHAAAVRDRDHRRPGVVDAADHAAAADAVRAGRSLVRLGADAAAAAVARGGVVTRRTASVGAGVLAGVGGFAVCFLGLGGAPRAQAAVDPGAGGAALTIDQAVGVALE